jgi:hypothetical protein
MLVTVAYGLRTDRHQRATEDRGLDLNADWRGDNDVVETLQMLPDQPAPMCFAKMLTQGASLGRLHAAHPSCRCAALAKVLIVIQKYGQQLTNSNL